MAHESQRLSVVFNIAMLHCKARPCTLGPMVSTIIMTACFGLHLQRSRCCDGYRHAASRHIVTPPAFFHC